METLKYIAEYGLSALTDVLGIKIKEHPDGLINLDYCQIYSPKLHPVVQECRGLILHKDTLDIVCHSMGRFLNHSETGCTAVLDNTTEYFDKVDGSLIKIYYFNGKWYIATRGTVFADNTIHDNAITFADLVYTALKVDNHLHFTAIADNYLNKNITYHFEITSPLNRVVTRYEGFALTYLNARITKTGEYVDERHVMKQFGAQLLTGLKFQTIQEAEEYVDALTDLKEGLVAYNDGKPVAKLKNSLYVQVHHTRGEAAMTPKRIARLIFEQEQDEYLGYFPEDRFLFEPYIEAYDRLFSDFANVFEQTKTIETQKEFALAVKDYPFKSLLFAKRLHPSKPLVELLLHLKENSKYELLISLKA